MSRKTLASGLILLLIVNLVLFGMGITGELVFWIILAVVALVSYFGFKRQNIYKQKE